MATPISPEDFKLPENYLTTLFEAKSGNHFRDMYLMGDWHTSTAKEKKHNPVDVLLPIVMERRKARPKKRREFDPHDPVSPEPFRTHRLKGECPICHRECYSQAIEYEELYFDEAPPIAVRLELERLFDVLGKFIRDHIRKEHGRTMSYTYTDSAWGTWTTDATLRVTDSTSSTCTSTAWTYWASDQTATTDSTAVVWVTWTDEVGSYRYVYGRDYEYRRPPAESAEQRRARLDREREEREKREQEAALRLAKEKERKEKARQLLREVLSDKQNKDLDEKGHFDVLCPSGAIYRINKGYSNNVKRLDAQGKVVESLCFHPKEYYDDYDTMCLQKMMLQFNEEGARQSANIYKQ